MKQTNRNFVSGAREKMRTLFPGKRADEGSRQFRSILWGIIAVFAFAILVGGMSFLLTLQGSEIILVPDFEDMSLLEALEELQSRNLLVHIQSRFFEKDVGLVINQRPNAGSRVRLGRTVTLIVSKGPVLDEVGNYIGMTLQDLRQQFAAQFATHAPLLEVKTENISYIFSEESEQTILEQDPPAGQKLAEYTELKLLVSRGPTPVGIEAPEAVGLDYRQALGMLAGRNIPFIFQFSNQAENSSSSGTVIAQQPGVGEQITGHLELFISPLEAESRNQSTGIFSTILPDFPVLSTVAVEFVNSIGEAQPYFNTLSFGGELSFPYIYETGSTIRIYLNGELLPESALQPQPQIPERAPEGEVDDETEAL